MLIYPRQFFKVGVIFHTLYLWNEVGDLQFFSYMSDTSNLLSDSSKNLKKIHRLENFRSSVLKLEYFDFVCLHFHWAFLTLFAYIFIIIDSKKRNFCYWQF